MNTISKQTSTLASVEGATVVEFVRYKLLPSVSDVEHLEAVAATEPFLRDQAGFVRRVLSKGQNGIWVDYLEWESEEMAAVAMQQAQADPRVLPFLQTVDAETIDFSYLEIQYRVN